MLLTACTFMPAQDGAAQTKVLNPGENLVTEGLPPIPASLVDDVRRYTEFRFASLADWHPISREILISTRFANTAQIHRVKQPGGARTQLTFFSEPVGAATYEPRAGQYFLFGRDAGGNEFAQIYRYDMADGRITLLTDGGRSQNGGIEWSTHGDRIAYGSTRRNGADRDIWVLDPLDPKTDRLALQVTGGGWYVADWSPDDKRCWSGRRSPSTKAVCGWWMPPPAPRACLPNPERRASPTVRLASARTAPACTLPATKTASSSASLTWTWRRGRSPCSWTRSRGTSRSWIFPPMARPLPWRRMRRVSPGSTCWIRAAANRRIDAIP
jgi:dipeptidyl aminopeptidase/acylaminoacyl peptidase